MNIPQQVLECFKHIVGTANPMTDDANDFRSIRPVQTHVVKTDKIRGKQ